MENIGAFLFVLIGSVLLLLIVKIIYDICVRGYVKLRNISLIINNYKDINELNRDINIDYSPAVLSYLMDQKVEKKKDILATLLKLYADKTINIYKENGNFVFEQGEVLKKMNSDELYIFLCFTRNRKINIKDWKEYVQEEYSARGFSQEKLDRKIKIKRGLIKYVEITLVEIAIIVTILMFLQLRRLIFIISLLTVLINYLILVFAIELSPFLLDENIFLSQKGKKEIKKWLKFKKFVKQYTLIKDRTIEETKLFEKYIPYAMALNINQAYKDKRFNLIDIDELIKYIISDSFWFYRERF